MIDLKSNISDRLKIIRKRMGLTQERVAELGKITTEYYRNIENGKFLPSIDIINNLHNAGWDVDYVLIGKKSEESVFSKYLSNCSEAKKDDIYNILLYKIIQETAHNGTNVMYIPTLGESKSPSWNVNERAKSVILNEIGRSKNQNEAMANIMEVSTRTIERWVDGTTNLKTSMILALYRKYQYPPSYILYGEFNSNSKCDVFFSKLSAASQNDVLELAQAMARYM
jgi:transcriptional regulator with XRE-family HTH domain